MKIGNYVSLVLWGCAILAMVSMVSGCAVTQEEANMNNVRQDVFRDLNKERTYQPVTISGVQEMRGDNITITTMAETAVVQAPSLQYDTSRNDIIGKAVGIAGNVAMGGIAAVAAIEVTKAVSDAVKVEVVDPVIVKPEVVKPEIVYPEDAPVGIMQ